MLIAWVYRTRLNAVFSGHKLKLTFIGPYDIGAELNLILVFAARFRRTVNVDYRAHFLMADSSHQFAQSELVFCHARILPLRAIMHRLHKFRATFATLALWTGVDLRTVQPWMRHTGYGVTMRYLKPNRSQAVLEKVNRMFD